MEEIKEHIGKLNDWVRKHRLFALSAPVILLLMIFFVSTTIKSMSRNTGNNLEVNGYNNKLPNQDSELDVMDPNEIFKNSQRDSLNALSQDRLLKTIDISKKENDSLQQILQELDQFSFAGHDSIEENIVANTKEIVPVYVDKKTKAQEKLEYRKLLMEARAQRLSKSQDYSAPYYEVNDQYNSTAIEFEAAIYRDQFVLPNDRVNLILRSDTYFNGKLFPKNTFLYAICNIQGSRILLEVNNIENMKLSMVAKDVQDGMIGLYNERAGELMQEFKLNLEEEGIENLTGEISSITDKPLARNLGRALGNYFIKRKYKQKDKILLVNGDRLLLVAKQ